MFADEVNNFMIIQNNRLFHIVPSARHLVDDSVPLKEQYYIRHRIETVKRIWLTSRTDALALAKMIDEDYDAARDWSKYIYQELNHDLLYLQDLKKHEYSLAQVASIPTFQATVNMVNYLEGCISRFGSIPAVAYSIWVEWNSDKASTKVVERAKKVFSESYVKGAKAHTMVDINEDHYQIMLSVAQRLLARGQDELVFYEILNSLTDFFIDYFKELSVYSNLVEA